jgi:hypothetical protein
VRRRAGRPARVPTLSALEDQFVTSDRTFLLYTPSSWGRTVDLVSSNLDGFTGDNPFATPRDSASAEDGGCDSKVDAPWVDPNDPTSKPILVPPCIPNRQGQGQ